MADLHVGDPPYTYGTIQGACTVAGDDDVVHVHKNAAGYYGEGNIANPGNHSITVRKASDVTDDYIQIDATGYANGFIIGYWTLTWGFEILNATGDGVVINTSTLWRCWVHDCGGDGVQCTNDNTIRRCKIHDNAVRGIARSSGTQTIESCEVRDNAGEATNAAGATIEQCTFADNNSGGTYQVNIGAGTIRNCIVYDSAGATDEGINCTGTYDHCCSYGHAVANYHQAPDVDSIEADPLFNDAAGDDYRLTVSSPCYGTGSSSATTTTDLDGHAFASPPSMGAYELQAIDVVLRGTHRILVYSPASLGDDALSPSNWSLTGTGNVPLIAAGSFPDAGDDTVLQLDTDRTLVEGVTYTLTPGFSSPSLLGASFTGLRASLPRPEEAGAALLDIDAPFVRPERRGGDYTITSAGDHALSGGQATVLKIVWTKLITIEGEMYWAPGFGSRLKWKRLRPTDIAAEEARLEALIESTPYVDSATVTLTWDGDTSEMVVELDLATSVGPAADERRFTA